MSKYMQTTLNITRYKSIQYTNTLHNIYIKLYMCNVNHITCFLGKKINMLPNEMDIMRFFSSLLVAHRLNDAKIEKPNVIYIHSSMHLMGPIIQ